MTKTKTASNGSAAYAAPTPDADARLLSESLERTAAAIDSMADRYTRALGECEGRLHRAMLMARAISSLREAMTDKVMAELMPLMNSPNGFKTDRPNQRHNAPYGVDVVKEAIIAGLLGGVFPTGNEFNIIAGQCYITQEGYRRKLREVPGLTDLSVAAGIPTQHNGQMVVRVAVSWVKDGRRSRLVGADDKPGRVFAVAGTSADQLIGKATRKALKAAFEQATGTIQTVDDNDGVTELPSEPAPQTKAQQVIQDLQARIAQPPDGKATKDQLDQLARLARELEWSEDEFLAELWKSARAETPEQMTAEQAGTMIRAMQLQTYER